MVDQAARHLNIDPAELPLYLREQMVQIIEICDITTDGRCPITQFGHGEIQCLLVAAGDHHLSPVFNEPVGGC